MNIWRAVHRELGTAWRSLRYDLRRRESPLRPAAGEPAATTADAKTVVLPKVVETDADFPEYEAYVRRLTTGWRMRTALVAATLAATGAAATYLGVVSGMSALLVDELGLPSALPGVSDRKEPAPDQPAPGRDAAPPAVAERPSAVAPEPVAPPAGSHQPGQPDRSGQPDQPDRPDPAAGRTGGGGSAGSGGSSDSDDRPGPGPTRNPPVPTPAPDPTPTCGCPSPTGSPDPSSSPTPTGSPSPSSSPEPSGSSGSEPPWNSSGARAS